MPFAGGDGDDGEKRLVGLRHAAPQAKNVPSFRENLYLVGEFPDLFPFNSFQLSLSSWEEYGIVKWDFNAKEEAGIES